VIRPLILIVIDEPALRYLFDINLNLRGYDVIDMRGSVEVLDFVEKNRPDMVILDLMTGSVNGFDLCKELCDCHTSSVIAFNMRGGDADLLKCLEMGVDDYIGKPFGIDELIARINAVLRKIRFNGQKETAKIVERSKAY
jgi:DNA-binding response OmpR family regulator